MSFTYVVIDTETTGFMEPECVEFGYTICVHNTEGFKIIDSYSQLFKPNKPIECGAMGIHHITNEMVKDCSPFPHDELNLQEILKYLSFDNDIKNSIVILVGHNLPFDLGVLPKFLNGLNVVDLSKILELDRNYHTSKVVYLFDTLKAAKNVYGKKYGDVKNSTLCYALGINKLDGFNNKTHSVLTDTFITAHIMKDLMTNYTVDVMFKRKDKVKVEIDNDITICMFPKFKGKTWKYVLEKEPDYVDFLIGVGKLSKLQIEYIKTLS